MDRVETNGLGVARVLFDFVEQEALPGTGLDPKAFWAGFAAMIGDLAPENRRLLAVRDTLQSAIDAWHDARRGQSLDMASYKTFLAGIGYLAPEGPDFTIAPPNVDLEVSRTAGPQLVVPLSNARYALNAANARWGSLYDALYGTDVIADDADAPGGTAYDPRRGARVIAYARDVLDRIAPLAAGAHAEAT